MKISQLKYFSEFYSYKGFLYCFNKIRSQMALLKVDFYTNDCIKINAVIKKIGVKDIRILTGEIVIGDYRFDYEIIKNDNFIESITKIINDSDYIGSFKFDGFKLLKNDTDKISISDDYIHYSVFDVDRYIKINKLGDVSLTKSIINKYQIESLEMFKNNSIILKDSPGWFVFKCNGSYLLIGKDRGDE